LEDWNERLLSLSGQKEMHRMQQLQGGLQDQQEPYGRS
jgi:hypothetical protein